MAAKSRGGRRRISAPASHYRSAVSGRYVKAAYAKAHPKTTVKESK